ncbi:zinc finger BED domain-containing protein DAYSLEEPER-like [Apium graveolens]|uniref:zinc finger BED domain-containing protein DAYSLEEPER-like n=1 Tax=Apium graveolens TaxID=4045 RepID=UPI003D795BD9
MQSFVDKDKNGKSLIGPPGSKDWENCVFFCRFLKVFYEATLKFSASLFVTSNSYFHEVFVVRGKLLKWSSSDKLNLKDMALKMKLKYDKYWGNIEKQNILLYVAVVLDPRYKLKFVTCCLRKLYGDDDVNAIVSSLNECLSKLMSHYSNEIKLKNSEDVTPQGGPTNLDKSTMLDSDDDDSFNLFESEFDKECDEDEALDTKNELDRYLMERNEDRKNKDFDILVWWKMSSTKYPVTTRK